MSNRSYVGSITKYREIGRGAFSRIYECDYYDSYFAYKEFIDKKSVEKFYDNLVKLQKYNDDTRFVFPYQFIYAHPNDKYFVGYVIDLLYKYENLNKLHDLDYSKKIHLLKKARELVEVFNNKYGFLHTDLSPMNFMYSYEKDDVKLIDFDLSVDLNNPTKELVHNHFITDVYTRTHGIDKDLDMFIFNLTTYAVLNNVSIYDVILYIINNEYGCIENSQAIDILSRYSDIENNTLKKEYVIDYLK